jgi:hypothetical protein
MAVRCRVSIDWRYQSAALPPGVMTDMPFQLDALGLYQVSLPAGSSHPALHTLLSLFTDAEGTAWIIFCLES